MPGFPNSITIAEQAPVRARLPLRRKWQIASRCEGRNSPSDAPGTHGRVRAARDDAGVTRAVELDAATSRRRDGPRLRFPARAGPALASASLATPPGGRTPSRLPVLALRARIRCTRAPGALRRITAPGPLSRTGGKCPESASFPRGARLCRPALDRYSDARRNRALSGEPGEDFATVNLAHSVHPVLPEARESHACPWGSGTESIAF